MLCPLKLVFLSATARLTSAGMLTRSSAVSYRALKEADLGSVDVATDLDLVFKDKGDMAAGPIAWDAEAEAF